MTVVAVRSVCEHCGSQVSVWMLCQSGQCVIVVAVRSVCDCCGSQVSV